MQPMPPNAPPPINVIDGLVPTNPLAAVACWTGIFSMILCFGGALFGPIAVVTGIISLKKGAITQQSSYGKATSTARSWIGIVTGALGTIIGIVFIVLQLLNHR
jgi:hypothetical protein